MKNKETISNETMVAILGGGCFWCLEAAFSQIQGVENVVSGYSGGNLANPNYAAVSTGKTGHAETVKITFNSKIVSFEEILHIFFSLHDPTTKDRQGNDVGPQYRSIIFYTDDLQRKKAEKIIGQIEEEKIYAHPIITEIVPFEKFYPAEEYHQKYFEKNPEAAYCQIVIAPKLSKIRQKFQRLSK